jgi:hypothetical protein
MEPVPLLARLVLGKLLFAVGIGYLFRRLSGRGRNARTTR